MFFFSYTGIILVPSPVRASSGKKLKLNRNETPVIKHKGSKQILMPNSYKNFLMWMEPGHYTRAKMTVRDDMGLETVIILNNAHWECKLSMLSAIFVL